MEDTTLINGLLAKRAELVNLNAELREKMAVVANDIEAVERVLDSLGYAGQLVGQTPRAARIVLFLQERAERVPLSRAAEGGGAAYGPRAGATALSGRGQGLAGPAANHRRGASGRMRAAEDAGDAGYRGGENTGWTGLAGGQNCSLTATHPKVHATFSLKERRRWRNPCPLGWGAKAA